MTWIRKTSSTIHRALWLSPEMVHLHFLYSVICFIPVWTLVDGPPPYSTS